MISYIVIYIFIVNGHLVVVILFRYNFEKLASSFKPANLVRGKNYWDSTHRQCLFLMCGHIGRRIKVQAANNQRRPVFHFNFCIF